MRLTKAMIGSFFCVVAALACNDTTSASSSGEISVQVIDANNAGVQTVNVDVYKMLPEGAILWREGSTSSNGTAVFGVDGSIEPGDYYVHVSFVTGYQLAAGETNDKAATVQGGDNVVITFHVVQTGPTH